ncbi:MAG: hypothetical protein ACOYOU_15845 [Kiritimatiellia bacterium]
MWSLIKSRDDGLWIGPVLAGMVGATTVAALWAFAVEVPVADILKTAVGPGVGALAGAYLAFQVQTRQKAHEKRQAQVAALREVQFAIHARLRLFSSFYYELMLPCAKMSDRWYKVSFISLGGKAIAPAIKIDQLGFLLDEKRPALLEEVQAADFTFDLTHAAITRWYDSTEEFRRAQVTGEAELQRWRKIVIGNSDAVYRAMPGVIDTLKKLRDDLIAEMADRFPGESSVVPIQHLDAPAYN